MELKNTPATYGSVAKFFHWLIFILLFTIVIYGYLLDFIPKAYLSVGYNIHKLVGLLILLLMLLRGSWALMNVKPDLPLNTRPWERFAERFVHYSLYLVVLAMPIVGWIGSTAAGRAPHIGSMVIALPVELNKSVSGTFLYLHRKLAIVLIILFIIHLSAALYHHFINKDNILRRMMPDGS